MVSKTSVVFIQGAGENAHAEDRHLASSLESHLGDGYDVIYPVMPNEGDPHYEQWKVAISKALAKANADLVLVAHSAGGPMVLRYLSEAAVPPLAGLFLIAPAYLGEGGWNADGVEMRHVLAQPTFQKQVADTTPVFLYHSRDDDTVPFAHQALYKAQLTHAVVREFDGRGHQFKNDLAEVARDIRRSKIA